MTQTTLFRPEVLAHLRYRWHGTVFMNVPVHYAVITTGYGLFLVALMLFVMLAEFPEQCTVMGYVNLTEGMVRAYAERQGTVVKSYVAQGENVKRGEPLFLIDTSYGGLSRSQIHDVLVPLQERKQALDDALREKQQHLDKLTPLLKKNYISWNDYQAKRDEIAALKRQKSMLDMEFIRYKQSRSYVVRAPVDGMVSNVMVYVGQHAQPTKPLLSLLPRGATFVADVFVPVAKAGFLNLNDNVLIHYDAYPYQRFGAAKGHVQAMGQTILTDADEDKPIQIKQPYYKVRVKLDQHVIMAYGKPRRIQQGMTFSAVMVGAKKKVWRWVLDPLYSLSAV